MRRTVGHPLWEAVRGLDLPVNDYAVFGNGPLAARDLIELQNDVDIVAREPARKKARVLGPVGVARQGDLVVRLCGGGIEVFVGWMGMDVNGIIDRAESIEGLPFACLADVLAFKRMLGQEDLEHIRLIEEHLCQDPP